jgi:hypothetical protein
MTKDTTMTSEYQLSKNILPAAPTVPRLLSAYTKILTEYGDMSLDAIARMPKGCSAYTGKRYLNIKCQLHIVVSENTLPRQIPSPIVEILTETRHYPILTATATVDFLSSTGAYVSQGLVKYIDHKTTFIQVKRKPALLSNYKFFYEILGLDEDNQTVLAEGLIARVYNPP